MPRAGAKIKAASNCWHHITAMKHECGQTLWRVNPRQLAIKAAAIRGCKPGILL